MPSFCINECTFYFADYKSACSDNLGGFYSSVGSTYCWSLDAGRAIPALLKAYEVTQDPDYLDAAKLAGYTFLYMMQHDPVNVGVVDKYYGAFVRAVTDGDAYDTIFMVEDLYDLIGLKMLAEQYDPANAARYARALFRRRRKRGLEGHR